MDEPHSHTWKKIVNQIVVNQRFLLAIVFELSTLAKPSWPMLAQADRPLVPRLTAVQLAHLIA